MSIAPGRFAVIATAVICLLAAAPLRAASTPETLPVIARVGPWPINARLIGFRDRLWFVNSVKGVDHNSADVYSLDPETGQFRYERHLWSQDAGQPLADGGLLYWPSEDPRVAGWGDFQVTNGVDWRTGQVPTAQIFHVHALAGRPDRLVAATSAWRAGLQVSADAGRVWRNAYDHETPDRRVSRIVSLAANHRIVVGELKDPAGGRLIRFDGAEVSAVPGWPANRAMSAPVWFRRAFYGLVHEKGGTAVWKTDGTASERIMPAAGDWRPYPWRSGTAACGRWPATRQVEPCGAATTASTGVPRPVWRAGRLSRSWSSTDDHLSADGAPTDAASCGAAPGLVPEEGRDLSLRCRCWQYLRRATMPLRPKRRGCWTGSWRSQQPTAAPGVPCAMRSTTPFGQISRRARSNGAWR